MILLVGKSGSGKSTIQKKLVEQGYEAGVSWMTRKPRDGEVDGIDGHFISREDFEHKIQAGFFAEHVSHAGNYYGTAKEDLDKNIVKIVEPRGLRALRAYDDGIIVVYIDTGLKERVRRMNLRGEEKDELQRRMILDYHLFDKVTLAESNISFDNNEPITDKKIKQLVMLLELMKMQRAMAMKF